MYFAALLLLGHDSGKLFYAGKYPTQVVCPVSGLVVGFYGKGDTYDRVFTSMGSSYEECRAECVGLHLCLVPGVTEIFGYSGAQAKDIKYANWVSMILSGLKEFSPVGGEWEQSHS